MGSVRGRQHRAEHPDRNDGPDRTTGSPPSIVAVAVALSACGSDEPPDVAAAQEQFCADVEEYVAALDTYGGLFADVDLTVGEVREAGEALDPGREAVLESAEVFRQAVEADPTAGVTIEIVEPETLDDGRGRRTPPSPTRSTASTTAPPSPKRRFRSHPPPTRLQVAWVRVFADAGCIAEEDTALASQWVSDYVSALQTDLQTLGYYSGSIDGIYGPQTLAAVEEFQEANGLPVTGLPDPATQTALQTALEGRASAQVAALQGILITLGYFPGPIDGQWTPQLEEALKAFQTDLGVPATGTVDTATLRAFEEALAAEGAPPATTVAPPPGPDPTSPPTTAAERPTTTRTPETTTTAPPPPETTTTRAPAGGVLDVLADAGGFTAAAGGDRDRRAHREAERTWPAHPVRPHRRGLRPARDTCPRILPSWRPCCCTTWWRTS